MVCPILLFLPPIPLATHPLRANLSIRGLHVNLNAVSGVSGGKSSMLLREHRAHLFPSDASHSSKGLSISAIDLVSLNPMGGFRCDIQVSPIGVAARFSLRALQQLHNLAQQGDSDLD